MKVFLLLKSNLLGQQCSFLFLPLKIKFFSKCAAVWNLLKVPLRCFSWYRKCTFNSISFLESDVLVEYKKENASCLKHDWSYWQKLYLIYMDQMQLRRLAASSVGEALLLAVSKQNSFPLLPVLRLYFIWSSLYSLFSLWFL